MNNTRCSITGKKIKDEDVCGCIGGEYCRYCSYISEDDEQSENIVGWIAVSCIVAIIVLLVVFWPGAAHAYDYSDDQIADAIYLAEGGSKTNHPYGILKRYKNTTPRQACINTIRSSRKRWIESKSKLDYIDFLQKTYAPIGAKNDPKGLNKNWSKNVKYFLSRQ